MAKRKRRTNLERRLKRWLPVEAIIVLAAFIPYTRRGSELNHGFLAGFLFDQPGYIVSSLVNFVVFNLLFFALVFAFTRATAK